MTSECGELGLNLGSDTFELWASHFKIINCFLNFF